MSYIQEGIVEEEKRKEIANMIVQECYILVIVVVVVVVPGFLRALYVAVLAVSQTPYSKGSYKNP